MIGGLFQQFRCPLASCNVLQCLSKPIDLSQIRCNPLHVFPLLRHCGCKLACTVLSLSMQNLRTPDVSGGHLQACLKDLVFECRELSHLQPPTICYLHTGLDARDQVKTITRILDLLFKGSYLHVGYAALLKMACGLTNCLGNP